MPDAAQAAPSHAQAQAQLLSSSESVTAGRPSESESHSQNKDSECCLYAGRELHKAWPMVRCACGIGIAKFRGNTEEEEEGAESKEVGKRKKERAGSEWGLGRGAGTVPQRERDAP
eukprot:3938035-Rhodomonas_salina.1